MTKISFQVGFKENEIEIGKKTSLLERLSYFGEMLTFNNACYARLGQLKPSEKIATTMLQKRPWRPLVQQTTDKKVTNSKQNIRF